jgi:hypothetical protein
VGGALSGKLPPARAVQIGVGLELIGVLGVALFASTEAGWAILAPFLFLYGIGIGLATAQLTGVIMVDVPMTSTGQASGSQSTVRQVGSALGVAVLGTLLFTGTQVSMEQRLSDLDVPREQSVVLVDAVVDSAGSVIPQLTDGLVAQQVPQELAEDITTAAGDAFTDGAKWAAWSAAGFLLLGFASTFYLGSQKTKKKKRSVSKR